jgi:hypothetical protein
MNSGSVSGTSQQIGGLIGSGSAITITNSMNSGSVSGTSMVGGLLGDGWNTITITNSMNSGSVSGTSQQIGGLIGSGDATNITNSMNRGNMSGTYRVGGLIGYVENQLFVYNSLNLGNVIAMNSTTEVGGITGLIPTTNDFEKVFYNASIKSKGIEIPGIIFGTKVSNIGTLNLAFFTTTLGWDTDIWDFTGLDIANAVYPTLKNMPEIPLEE